MDLSKLPRLSNTPGSTPPPPAPAATPQPVEIVAKAENAPAAVPPPAGPAAALKPCPYCAAPLRPAAKFCDNCGSPVRVSRDLGAGVGAEAWISIGLGIILLLFFPTTVKYYSHQLFHTKFAPYDAFDAGGNPVTDKNGNPEHSDYVTLTGTATVTAIPYRHTEPNVSPNFWNDMAITTFALALMIEGVALVLSRRTFVVFLALLVTLTATLINLVFLVSTFNKYGIAIISAMAVLFGVYMAIYQFRLLQISLGEKAMAHSS